jgi:aminoglycoside phosphotransferase (APT) family kinase protein
MEERIPETPSSQETDLAQRLLAWARASHGEAAHVSAMRALGGHSQVTVGFTLHAPGRPDEPLVLKMPPAGVAARNNFDVLRQVPLLQLLAGHGIPAPQPRHWSGDTAPFGGPFLMMSRLPGASPGDIFTERAGAGVVDAAAQFREAARVLARIHAIDATEVAAACTARGVTQEIDHWEQVVRRSSNAAWVALAMRVREALHRQQPGHVPIGLVHGDYYSNNWVFDGAALSGVVDWEGATLGPSLLDIGWLAIMYEPQSWGPLRRPHMAWHPAPRQLIDWYAQASGADLTAIDWYCALAAYRLACITAWYFERHRSGKRRNPAWEVLGEAFEPLLAGACRRLRIAG